MDLACQVVPEIPSFAVDDGFTYLVPSGTTVSIGSKVRIKVSGRRLAGYVTAVFDVPREGEAVQEGAKARKLSALDSVTGSAPVFDHELLDVCRWAALRYVAPLSTVLKRTSPPNVPKHLGTGMPTSIPSDDKVVRTPTVTYRVSASPHHEAIALAVSEGAHRSRATQAVVVPTAAEAHDVAGHLRSSYGDRVVVATSSMAARDVTNSWAAASQDPSTVLVGTREIGLWKLAGGGSWTIVEDGRRVMKSPATPTLHVRDIVVTRSAAAGTDLEMIGPVPTLEAIAHGASVIHRPGRSWPLVEVVDRTEEPPSASLLTERAKMAISGAAKVRAPVFVLVTARGYAPAFRCVSCSELRRCPVCDTAASTDSVCRRCQELLGPCRSCGSGRFAPLGAGIGRVADEIRTFVGEGVGAAGEEGLRVAVGSERDLVELGDIGLGVVIDIDGMTGAPHYRAAEDALRLAVRVAHHVSRGKGHRLLVQTSSMDQPVVRALLAGHSESFLAAQAAARRSASFPPYGELVAVEVGAEHDPDQMIREGIGSHGTVLGPAAMKDRNRWLIQGADLTAARMALRGVVGALRSRGARVRVDADPIDL